MPTSPSWPRTNLNWKRAVLLSLKCVYFMLVVTLSQKSAEMAMKSSLHHKHLRGFQEGNAAAAAAAALT